MKFYGSAGRNSRFFLKKEYFHHLRHITHVLSWAAEVHLGYFLVDIRPRKMVWELTGLGGVCSSLSRPRDQMSCKLTVMDERLDRGMNATDTAPRWIIVFSVLHHVTTWSNHLFERRSRDVFSGDYGQSEVTWYIPLACHVVFSIVCHVIYSKMVTWCITLGLRYFSKFNVIFFKVSHAVYSKAGHVIHTKRSRDLFHRAELTNFFPRFSDVNRIFIGLIALSIGVFLLHCLIGHHLAHRLDWIQCFHTWKI